MWLLETAKTMLEAGASAEEVRAELRGSSNADGANPTCSYVEEVLREAYRLVWLKATG